MRRCALLVIMLAALSGCQTLSGGQSSQPFASDDEFRHWFAFYYQEPNPDRLTEAVRFMHTNAYLHDFPDIASVFMGRVIAANVDRLPQWHDDWSAMGSEEWSVILMALWLSNTPEGASMMHANLSRAPADQRARFQELIKHDPTEAEVLTTEVVNPRQINMIWAAFSATGDERLVRKVVSYVHYYGGSGDAEVESQIGEAAIMTLASNLPQHELVERVCVEENLRNPNPKTRLLLQTMFNVLAQLDAEARGEAKPAH
jgi:hypothetical protein